MSNAGQAALGIVGGIVGFIVGGPTGALYGAQLGLAVGTIVSPTQLPGTYGPRLTDNRTTTSQIGATVVEVFGTDAVAGTVMYLGKITETATTTEVGGKGSPTGEQTTYSYSQPIGVGLCSARNGAMGGILRIWENGKIVYDIREQQSTESDTSFDNRLTASAIYADTFTLYLGDEDQMPDPTIEADKGVGNVPAFRGLMYIVYHDRQLRDDQARRHPNFKFEVYEDGLSNCGEVTYYSNDVLYPWDPSAAGKLTPEYAPNIHRYRMRGEARLADYTPGPWRSNLLAAWSDASDVIGGDGLDGNPILIGWSQNLSNDLWSSEMRPIVGPGAENRVSAYLHLQTVSPGTSGFTGYFPHVPTIFVPGFTACYSLIAEAGLVNGGAPFCWWTNLYDDEVLSNTQPIGFWWWGNYMLGQRFPREVPFFDCGMPGPDPGFLMWLPDVIVEVQRILRAPPNPCAPLIGPNPPPYGEGYCVINGLIVKDAEWEYDDSTFYHVLRKYGAVGALQTATNPLNPALPIGHADDTQEFWEAAYAQAVSQGTMPGGLVYDTDYPQDLDHGYKLTTDVCSAGAFGVSIASIVRRICLSCGLQESDIDVSDLEDKLVNGYQVRA